MNSDSRRSGRTGAIRKGSRLSWKWIAGIRPHPTERNGALRICMSSPARNCTRSRTVNVWCFLLRPGLFQGTPRRIKVGDSAEITVDLLNPGECPPGNGGSLHLAAIGPDPHGAPRKWPPPSKIPNREIKKRSMGKVFVNGENSHVGFWGRQWRSRASGSLSSPGNGAVRRVVEGIAGQRTTFERARSNRRFGAGDKNVVCDCKGLSKSRGTPRHAANFPHSIRKATQAAWASLRTASRRRRGSAMTRSKGQSCGSDFSSNSRNQPHKGGDKHISR